MSLSLSLPDSTYTTSNKPAIITLKSDLSAIETDLNAHEASSSAHGVTGSIADTTSVQTFTNKTLTSPTITSPSISSWDGWQAISATLTYSSADSPTYVCTTSSDLTGSIGVGMRIKLTHGGSVKYFIVTAIDTTTITLYGGTDYTLAATAITLPYLSTQKAPLGFPLSTAKWQVEVLNAGDETQATPTQSTWYNLGTTEQQINIPIGVWSVSYYVMAYGSRTAAGVVNVATTLSTANNSESDADFTAGVVDVYGVSIFAAITKSKTVALTTKATYYLNTRTIESSSTSIQNFGATYGKTILRAVCAYL